MRGVHSCQSLLERVGGVPFSASVAAVWRRRWWSRMASECCCLGVQSRYALMRAGCVQVRTGKRDAQSCGGLESDSQQFDLCEPGSGHRTPRNPARCGEMIQNQ